MDKKTDYFIEISFFEVIKKLRRLKVKEHTIPFYFDMYCWCNFVESEGITFDDFEKYTNEEFAALALYYGALSACKDIGLKVNFTKSDVKRWTEIMPYPKFQALINCMLNSRIGGKSIIETWQGEEDKEKKK